MKKLLFIILLLFFSSSVYAIDDGTYYKKDNSYIEKTQTSLKYYSSSGSLLRDYTFYNHSFLNTSKGLSMISSQNEIYYVDGVNNYIWYLTSTNRSGLGFPVSDYALYTPSDTVGFWSASDTRFVYDTSWFTSVSSNITIYEPISNHIILDGELLTNTPSQTCTSEIIPSYDFIDFHPTSTGSITEIYESDVENTYGYATSLSGDYPLQIIFLGVDDVGGFNQFATQSGSINFNTENKTVFSDDNTFLNISSSALITDIKLLGDYGNVDIFEYDSAGNKIINTFRDVDLSSYNTGRGYSIGGDAGLVAIRFVNGLSDKVIDTLEVYGIGYTETRTVEICHDTASDTYTVDGEEYTGNPYTDLVGNPEPVTTFFSENGYTFYDNGFCLNDFIPQPTGGELIFEILNPEDELKASYAIKSSGLYTYGNNTCSKITTNYHNIAGVYYVRATYIYQSVKYYPMGENFYTYTISNPEYIEGLPEDYFSPAACEGTGIDGFVSCTLSYVRGFFSAISNFVGNIRGLYQAIGELGNTEERKVLDQAFNFLVPGVYAETYEYKEEEDVLKIISQGSFEEIPLLKNLYNLIKYAIMGFLLFWIITHLSHKKENNV